MITAASSPETEAGTQQSLAIGAAGRALLAVERAAAGHGPWTDVHRQLHALTASGLEGGDHTGLFYGAPAVAFVLHCASTVEPRYRPAAAKLDPPLLDLARRHLHRADQRHRRGGPTTFAEYDLFYGLTGLGALLLRRAPDSDVFADLLRYLSALTEPRRHDDQWRPGWWVEHHPDPLLPTPGGHANLGMAHGAAGILALLALAIRHGCLVDGQLDAIDRLVAVFDAWRHLDADGNSWWPQWLTIDDLRTNTSHQPTPGLPSWCYGTPGIARALHIAAIATGQRDRQADAERVLAQCAAINTVHQLTEPGLCHGRAGLYQTLHRAVADQHTRELNPQLPALTPAPGAGTGLLTGSAGADLAALTAAHGTVYTGWDACLLIT
jgi:lantibiotic biosynthesis protein